MLASNSDHQTIASKVLRFDQTQVNDSGLYECRVQAGGAHFSQQQAKYHSQAQDSSAPAGDQLRKIVKLVVNGK